ncbi:TIGR04211 family SH3 domain-containing protein [Candidatus Electronema sp. PJ]|uniref:TIGR04211 family SH3 domain-containing protein n=1 Tax=Candidatus Electronema sp. PJ TaxID=3401572 RepID=UPI003AA8AFC1
MNRGNRAVEGQHISFPAHSAEIKLPRSLFLSLLAGGAAFLLLPVVAGAQTMFVSQNIDIPVRRGAGEQYKIIKMVRVNDKTELLEERNDWGKVRFQDGEEGWLPKSLLTPAIPVVEDTKNLRTENEQLRRKNNDLNMELSALKEHQNSEGDKLAACINEQNMIKAERRAVEDTGKVIWFLSGGGVLLLGWLLGRLSFGSQKKRSGLR